MTTPELFFSCLGFCSASHADSSFAGASDIGQWFTPGSRCNFGSRWILAHTQVVSNLGTRRSTDQMPVESPSSPNQGLTGIKGNQRHSSKMIKTFPFAVVSHSFSGSQSAPIPDGTHNFHLKPICTSPLFCDFTPSGQLLAQVTLI